MPWRIAFPATTAFPGERPGSSGEPGVPAVGFDLGESGHGGNSGGGAEPRWMYRQKRVNLLTILPDRVIPVRVVAVFLARLVGESPTS
jgi:hypothetical protein